MLFSSITFLYYFIPCVMILYFIIPKSMKNSVLLLSSLFFYGWGEPKFLVVMMASIIQGYLFGRLIETYRSQKLGKVFWMISAGLSLCVLGYCKYADFFIRNLNAVTGMDLPILQIALPIGISFYTFQILSYVTDVYNGQTPAQKNFINLALYISMFPQLIAGPIVRYTDIAPQIENRDHHLRDIAWGIRRFTFGLSKKILIANTLYEYIAEFKLSDEKTIISYWMYILFYTLHIYFDFSGYSDMAIGLGRIFGFHFQENFRYPYISSSITEFWRNWHISLGTWFRDYLYIPLGGNRVSKTRWMFNIGIVWIATGLWHGAEWTFVLWGILFALLLMSEKLWLLPRLQKMKIISHVYVLFFVLISFVLFDASSVGESIHTLASMFGYGNIPFINSMCLYDLQSYAVLLLIAIVCATPLPIKLIRRIYASHPGQVLIAFAEPFVLTALLSVCTGFLVDGSFNPFLYFRF